jgi:two-component system, sensor histidine kinase and response regulator
MSENTITPISEKNNILIVDDQITILKPLSRFMNIHNINVETRTSSKDALAALENKNPYDLIILDVLMPDLNGFELCHKIREKYSMYELPVIFITAKNHIDDLVSGFEAGANDYIFKPFDLNELLARSRNLIKLKKLTEKNQHLQESIDFKNQFHQMTVHDLKNPLSSIIVLSDLLKAEEKNPSHLEFLNVIQSSTNKMLDLIANYLDMHKLETGKISLKRQDVDFESLIRTSVSDNEGHALQKKQKIIINGNFDSAFPTHIDRMRIEQVVDNLISNAIKYSVTGAEIIVNVLYETDKYKNKYLSICVKDKGPGFTKADKAKMFEQFCDLSAEPTGGESSTGLGLSIAKEIISLHNGEIWAESVETGGSKLCFKIPV